MSRTHHVVDQVPGACMQTNVWITHKQRKSHQIFYVAGSPLWGRGTVSRQAAADDGARKNHSTPAAISSWRRRRRTRAAAGRLGPGSLRAPRVHGSGHAANPHFDFRIKFWYTSRRFLTICGYSCSRAAKYGLIKLHIKRLYNVNRSGP